ncbi:MAG: ankyrin repeat domain-containing protein [Steroidobacteraceae bacterium]|jgi:ankyrin repeat protein
MNDVPPSNDDPDDIDDRYRRAAQLTQSRPSEAVRRAILEHAAKRAAEHAAAQPAKSEPVQIRRRTPAAYRSRWRPAIFGTLAAAALAGLLVTPLWHSPRILPNMHSTQTESAAPPAETTARIEPPTTQNLQPAAMADSGARPAGAAPRPAPRPAPARPSAVAGASSAAPLPADAEPPDVATAQRLAQAPALVSSREMAAARAAPALAQAARQRSDVQGLWQASESGDAIGLSSLLERPVDIDARDPQGRTALMLATLHARAAAVEVLLAHGADPNIPDTRGMTPLDVARSQNQAQIVTALQRAGAR